MRRTRQQQVILELVAGASDHPTAAQIYERARQALPTIGYATVYRTLRLLADAGAIREVRVANVTQYDHRTERHDHLVCRGCGSVGDVVVPVGSGVLEKVADQSGFRIEEYHVELFGLCAACKPGSPIDGPPN